MRTRLIVAPTKLSLGWPFRATCEVKNVGSVARTINPQGADYHRGLEVIGPDGKLCEFLHGPVSTFSEDIEIKPGESRKLFENIEISSLFLTPSAGEYTLRLNGGNKAKVGEIDDGRAPVPPPSEVKVTLTEGKLPPIQTLFLKLRPLAPKDWSVHLRGLAIHFTGPGPGKLAPVGTEPTAVQLWFAKTEFSETDEKARAAQHPNEKFPQLTRLGMTPFGFGHLSATGPALKDWPQCIEAIRKVAVVKLPVEVRLVGGPKAEPLSNVKVEFTTGHGSDLLSFGTFTTDEAGWLKTTLPDGFYYLHLKSEKEWPYLPYEKYWTGSSGGHAKSPNVYVTDKNADADGRSRTRESSDRSLTTPATGISDRTLTVEKWLGGYRRDNGFEPATNEHRGRITFTLEPAVELVLRAVDVETGKGLSGAAFYEEVADGEDWAHSVYGQNLGSKFAYNSNAERAPMSLTDNDGYLRRWVGEKGDESKFGVWKAPTGYELVEPKAELSVLTELGQARAEQVFKFRRIRWAVRLEPEKKKVTLGEPLTLTFFVKNATKETRGLELGGDDRNRLGRPESFEVRVINNKAKLMPVPDAGPTKGGLSSNVLLKPDGEAKVELKLSDWATITQPGNYRVFVKRTLKLFPIKAQQGDRIEWGDQPEVAKVAASCEFDVISPPRSEAQSRNEKGSGMSPEARVLTKPSVLLPDHWIVQAVGFDSDGKELVTASNQSFITIRRWDVVGMKLLSEIKLQGDRHGRAALPITLKFSGDRRRVIASTDAYVGIWDAVTGKLLKQLPFEKKDGIYDCAIDQLDCTPDLSVIVGHRVLPGRLTLSYDAHIIVWDGASGKVLRTLIDNGATVLKALDLSTDGKRLVTTNGGGAKIWDVSSGQLLRSIPNDNTGRKHSESDEADEKAVVRSANQRLITERSTTISSQYTSHVWSVQFSPDGKQMAMGDILGVKLLDATSGKLLRQLEGPYRFSSNASPGLVFSKDGERLARLGTQEKGEGGKHRYVVPIWSTRTGAREFELHTEANDAAFSNDGRCLAIVFSDMQQALSVWQLDDATADNIKTAGPGPHSRVDRVEENGHYVGKKAAEYIEQFKPTWGEAKLGLQYGIALTKQSAKFAQGEQVPLVVFFRNASSKPIKFDTAPDFFGNVPKVLNAKGEQFSLENIPLLGSIPHYHETLAPGEALGPFYLSTGLGENPHPNQQHWHPLLKSPVAGQCKLTHSVSVNVPGADPNVPATKAELTSSMVEFEIVDANKREFSGEPPELRLADVVRDFNAANKQLGRGLDQPAVTEDEVIASIKRDQWKRGDPQSLNEKEIAAFKAIAESKRLPKGSYLDVHTEEQSETFRLKQLWQVRLMIPAIGHDGFVGLTIRNTLVAEEKIDPKDVAWGKADAEGLSLGAYLSPRKAQFALGERVRLRLFVRNDGAKAVKTIWANTSHPMPDDFTVTDTTGAKVAVYIGHESWSLPWISSYTDGGALPPGATHALFVPYEISIGPEITYENGVPVHRVPVGQGIGGDGPNKLIGRIIAARPGQTLQLKVRAHNGNDRERKEGEAVPESGFVAFDVADKGNSADLK